MQTSWSGIGLPPANMVLEEVCVERSAWIVLGAPGVVTTVFLPSTPTKTTGVRLWTTDASCWYAIGTVDAPALPGPIPPPVTANPVPEGAFRLGGVLLPNERLSLALPDDSLPHTLSLVSEADGPRVLITCEMEML